MNKELLLNKLKEQITVKESELTKIEISTEKLKLKKIRDSLIKVGWIFEEDLDNSIYVGYIKTGFAKKNKAYIAVALENDILTILAYAREGLIKQNLVEQALSLFEKELGINLLNKSGNDTKKKGFKIGILITLIVFGSIGLLVVKSKASSAIEKTVLYNQEVDKVNQVIEDYNASVLLLSLESVEGVTESIEELEKVNEDFLSVTKSVLAGNSTDKIEKDLETLKELELTLSKNIEKIKALENPSKDWVIKKLKQVEGINQAVSVTKSTDINGLLNKEGGGYTACVYFSLSGINQKNVPGDTLVEKGTDAGGCVEVYKTKDDAIKRCDYLSGFDNTILYSGSYAVVGTMVIRTSYALDNDQQYSLTNNIINAFFTE